MTSTEPRGSAPVRVRIPGPLEGVARPDHTHGLWRVVLDGGGVAYLRADQFEVIREPLKRGDTVNPATDPEPPKGCVLRHRRGHAFIGHDDMGWWTSNAGMGLSWEDFRNDPTYTVEITAPAGGEA
jgi:hypothetical protein